MKKVILFLMALSALLSGCGSGGGSGSGPQGVGQKAGDNEPAVEKTDEEYFAQFSYGNKGNCGEPGGVWFTFLRADPVSIGRTAEGGKLFGRIEVYMLSKKGFFLNYREVEIFSGDINNYVGNIVRNETWYKEFKIENGKLILADFGVGERTKIGNEEAIRFVYAENFLNYAAVSLRGTDLKYIASKYTSIPGMKHADEYCSGPSRAE